MLFRTIARWAMVAWLLAIVTGCATVHQGIPEKLEPTAGAVVIKIVAVQRLGVTNGKWTRMTVVEQKSGIATELVDTAGLDLQYALFAQPLPAGTYSVKSLDAPGLAPATFGILGAVIIQAMTSDQHANQAMGSFTVEPGAVTNLGFVVAAPPAGSEKQMSMAVVADPRAQSSVSADLDAASRRHSQGLRTRSWDKAPDSAQLERALEIVRTRATYVSPLEVTRDGRVMLGTALGLVHVRDSAGKWSTLATGSFDTLGYVRELPDGRIFAGTTNGRYHLWNPATRSWSSHRVAEEGRVTQVEPMGAAGYGLMLSTGVQLGQPTKLKVVLVRDLAAPEATPREALALEGFPAMGAVPMLFDGRDLIVIFNHVGITRTADLYRIDPAVAAAPRQEKLAHWTGRFYRLSDNILVRDRMNGMTLYTDLSTDNGNTWQLSEHSAGSMARLTSRSTGYGLSFVSMGMTSSTFSLAKTSDGGKTWDKVGKPFDSSGYGNPLQLVLLNDQRPLVYTGGQLLSTTDDGATWTVEWPLSRAPAPQAGH